MGPFKDIGVEKTGHVALIEIRRPPNNFFDIALIKEIAEAFKDAKGNFGGAQEKMTALRKETTEKINGVLTADQRKAYKQMLGEEFKLEQKGFGGGAFGNKKKKKTTNE